MERLFGAVPGADEFDLDSKEPIQTGTGWARQRQRLANKARKDWENFIEEQRNNG